MKCVGILVILAGVAGVYGQQFSTEGVDPTTSTVAPTTDASTTTSTEKPTTVAPSTSSSTMAPTTETPTTSTVTPSTSTSEAPTTTVPSTTTEAPTETIYGVKNHEGKYCLLLQADMTFTLNNTRIGQLANGVVNDAESRCRDDRVTMWIDWTEAVKESTVKNHIQLDFNVTAQITNLMEVAAQINGHIAERHDICQYQTNPADNEYYKCDSENALEIENGITVTFSNMLYKDFGKNGTDKKEFNGKKLECNSDYHSNVIVVAVGCAMGGIVIIILVAYLVARRRNRQRGYQSV